MRGGGKSNQNQDTEEEEYEEEDFVGSRNPASSNVTTSNNTSNTVANSNKDGKNIDKVSAMRSKHSVTEQRRRSKINERFQILRDLIPHGDQKRDTASFLLEVIEYVRYLQEKVQKYEGSYQGWSPEPTKLMPWRNSHWHVQSFVGQPQSVRNGSAPVSAFSGKVEDNNNAGLAPAVLASTPNTLQCDSISKAMEQQPEVANKGTMALAMPSQAMMAANPLQLPVSDLQSAECSIVNDTMIQQEELVIEGGTINVSSAYSDGLLNTLTEALQGAGIDLSQAKISVQIDLGKRTNRTLTSGASSSAIKDPQNTSWTNQALTNLRDVSNGEHLDQAQKRLKT